MSFLRDESWVPDPRKEAGSHIVEERRAVRSLRFAEATVACARCDAPVAIGPEPLSIGEALTCPYCGHHGPVRDFLSLATPTRPTRVAIRVRLPEPR